MTVEQRLAEWLDRTTPEPPRAITTEDIARRVDAAPRHRAWVPVLAAACIVLIAAAAALIATRATPHRAAPPGLPSTRSAPSPGPTGPTASTHATPTATPTPTLRGLPWGAEVLRAYPQGDLGPLVSNGRSLYSVRQLAGGRAAIVRLNSATGEVAAQLQVAGEALIAGPVFAGGRVCVLARGNGSARVELMTLDATTLRPVADGVRLPAARAVTLLAASGDTAFVGGRSGVTAVDVPTQHIDRRYPVGTDVQAVAAHGGRLYVGTSTAEVRTYSVSTGELLGSTQVFDSVVGITPSDRGVWVHTASGMGQQITFDGKFGPSSQPGGGGVPATVGVFGSTAWLGGTTMIQCADANSGARRARAVLPTGVFVHDLEVVDGHVFALAYGDLPSLNLVELHPPAACGAP